MFDPIHKARLGADETERRYQSEVEAVVVGEAITAVADGSGNLVVQKRFRNRILRVHFRIVNGDRLIVTAYWTSKLKKYPA